jgi:tetratricopeptide (TPR) repeat protein
MKTLRHLAVVVFLVAVCASFSLADEPGKHPHYLHALSDLRDARAHLERITGSDRQNDEEMRAIDEIDKAIGEIKKASIDDGKNIQDHMPIDTHLGHKGRYHKALELIDKAHNDVAREEDDPYTRGLRDRAIHHIDEAHRIIDHLIINAAGD